MNDSATSREVIIITQEFYPKRGGIGVYTEEMAKAAASLGYTVEVWAPRSAKPEKTSWPFTVRRLSVDSHQGLLNSLRLAVEFVRSRHRLNNAIVYLSEPGPMRAWMLLPRLAAVAPVSLLLTFHGSEIIRFYTNPLLRLFSRRLMRDAVRIGTLTAYTRRLLLERFPETAVKIVQTPGALRTDIASCARPDLQGKPSKIIILTVGRIHPRKGQLLTLKALQNLPPSIRDQIEYWIVGSTSTRRYAHKIRNASSRPGLVVRLLGDLDEEALDRAYSQADIFALTSVDFGSSVEGFGLVYLEASAHGLPIIAHDVGGVAEAVDADCSGILVSPSEPAALTNAFARLIQNRELRQRMGAAGRERARRHSWKQAVATLFPPRINS